MTRDEYLSRLNEALNFMEEEARAAALTFYSEMLDDRMEDGMEEVAAVAAMDAPEIIAQRLRSEGTPEGKEADPDLFAAFAKQARQMAGDAWKAAGELWENAEKAAGKAIAKADEAIQSAASSIREEINKMERGGYDQCIFSIPAVDLTGVNLQARDMPMRVQPSKDERVYLTYYSCKDDPYAVRVENGVLKLQHQGHGKKKSFHFSMFVFGKEKLLWNQAAPMVELAVPAQAALSLCVETSNGSIQVGGLQALGHMELGTVNGRIALDNTCCQQLNMTTTNSRLELLKVQCLGRLAGSTSNGRIEMTGCRVEGDVEMSTSNGRVQAADCTALGQIALRTSNGAIHVEDLSASGLELLTSNGGISGMLPGNQADWAICSGTSNGSNSLPARQAGEKPLNVHTSNGSIKLNFAEK